MKKLSILFLILSCSIFSMAQKKLQWEGFASVSANGGFAKDFTAEAGRLWLTDYSTTLSGFTRYSRNNAHYNISYSQKYKAGVSAGIKITCPIGKNTGLSAGIEYSHFSFASKHVQTQTYTGITTGDTLVSATNGGNSNFTKITNYGDPYLQVSDLVWGQGWQQFNFSSINIPLAVNYDYKKWRFTGGVTASFIISTNRTTEKTTANPEYSPSTYTYKNDAGTSFNLKAGVSYPMGEKCRLALEYTHGLTTVLKERIIKLDNYQEFTNNSKFLTRRFGLAFYYQLK